MTGAWWVGFRLTGYRTYGFKLRFNMDVEKVNDNIRELFNLNRYEKLLASEDITRETLTLEFELVL